MIRSFADKMKIKQEAFAAEQEVLAEQAEQTRIQNEEILFEQELLEEKARVNQLFAEDVYRKEQKYLQEKEDQDAITRRRIEEWDAEADDRLAKIITKIYSKLLFDFAKNAQKLVDYFTCNIKLLEKKH